MKSGRGYVPDAALVWALHLEGEERLEPLLGEGLQHLHLPALECSEIISSSRTVTPTYSTSHILSILSMIKCTT